MNIHLGLLWGAITTTVTAVLWMFSTFASASDLEAFKQSQAQEFIEIKIDQWYGQFYDRLDDYEEALSEDRDELADEYKRQMERLKAQICEHDPEWERCDE